MPDQNGTLMIITHFELNLTYAIYSTVDSLCGLHTNHRLALSFNFRVSWGQFNSLYFEPSVKGLDDFAQNWQSELEFAEKYHSF